MFSDPKRAAELLSSFYVEREDNQWRSVTNCLKSLATGEVVPIPGLIAVAFNLVENDSPLYKILISRAQKLSNRTGNAGRVEVKELAKAAITIAISDTENAKLAAHTSRIGFCRELGTDLVLLVKTATDLTRQASEQLPRRAKSFKKLTEPLDIATVKQALAERDEYLSDQLWQRDKTLSIAMAAMMAAIRGQMSLWNAIEELLSPHSYPYPYRYETLATQACIAETTDIVNIDELPPLPSELHANDPINLPVLSYLTSKQIEAEESRNTLNASDLDIPEISLQILLELIFLRQESAT